MNLNFIALNHKIKVDIKDFILTGKFDHLKIGQTKSDLAALLPEPDDFFADTTLQEAEIWRYGKIALHFDDHQKLAMIFTSYVKELDGGDCFQLNNWILDKPVSLIQIQQELNARFMSYDVRVSTILNYVKIFLNHDIGLTFCPTHQMSSKPKQNDYNKFTLEAISLTLKGSIFDDSTAYK